MTQPAGDFEVVRDPLWDNIRLDAAALAVIDSPAVQRLRYVRQLGHAFLVYPGATHTRFEHALGAYHLTRRALAALEERDELAGVGEQERLAVRLAALLHDIGHYPFSHALEEAGFPSHELIGAERLRDRGLSEILTTLEPQTQSRVEGRGSRDLVTEIGALIQGKSNNPLAGLISGSIDLDKIDYLSRDARMCGVPYGTVDVDRLLASLTLIRNEQGALEVGVHEKGVSAMESLLFAKYQMYRNVYWHHAVRSATCMFKRAVREAVVNGTLTHAQVRDATDDGVMEQLVREGSVLAAMVRHRRLYKRALELPASDVPDDAQPWAWEDVALIERVEDRLAREVGLEAGDLLFDYPARDRMLSVDLLLRTRTGSVERLTDEGRAGQLGLPAVADHLYRSARRLRVFVSRPVSRSLNGVLDLIVRPARDVAGALDRDEPLLA